MPEEPYDIFVSYAHLDNDPLEGSDASTRWVSTLRLHLENQIQRKLGRRLRIWMDEANLRGHHEVTPQITGDVAGSAIMLAVVSPAYLHSEWCQKELDAFLGASTGNRIEQVFVVLTDHIDYDERPALLRDKKEYPFYWEDKRTNYTRQLGNPRANPTDVSEEEKAYFNRLESLAADITETLKKHYASRAVAPAPARSAAPAGGNGASGSTVYLAEVESYLYDKRAAVEQFLKEQNYRVAPEQPYSRTPSAYQEALDEDLGEAMLFVQLLGEYPSARAPDLPDGYDGLQLSRARASGVRALRWRSPGIDLNSITDSKHKELLSGADVVEGDLEVFMDCIRVEMDGILQEKAREEKPAPAGDFYFLLAALAEDQNFAQDVARCLGKSPGFGYHITSSDDLRGELEGDSYDAVLIFYDTANPEWVRDRVLEARRTMLKLKPPPAGAICIAPPAPPERELLARPPRFEILMGSDELELQAFLKKLSVE